jgi:hypothetical protein
VRRPSQRPNRVAIRSDYSKIESNPNREPNSSVSGFDSCDTLRKPQEKGKRMAPKKTYPLNEKQVTGKPVDVETSNEPWAQYTLADGTTVKAKMVMLEAIRLDAHNDNGDPIYQFQFQQIIGVVPAESLKKKAN